MAKRKKEIDIYGDLLQEFKPTIRFYIFQLLSDMLRKKSKKESFYKEDAAFSPPRDHLRELPLRYMAVVNGAEVLEIIRIDYNTAEMILEEDTILVPYEPSQVLVKKGMKYRNDEFVEEDQDVEKD